jgi:hypothetical protein
LFKKPNRVHFFLGPFFLLGIWTAYYFKVIFLGHTVMMMDASRVFYPLWKWQAGIFQDGFIPLWNSDAAFGTPSFADPEMDGWYPPVSLFYLIFNPTTAFNILVLGHHLLTLLGFWVFARERNFSYWSALAGSLVWGFAVPTACLTWDPVMLFSLAWIPWIFWAGDKLLVKDGKLWLFFPVFLALQWSSGYPIFGYLTLLFLGMEWFGKIAFLKSVHRLTTGILVKRVFISLLLAGGYNLAWGIPFTEFMKFSNISQRLDMSQSLGFEYLGSWLNPFFKGHPLFTTLAVPYWLGTYFLGLPSLVLIFWSFLRKKADWITVGLWLFALGLSLGETTEVGHEFKQIFPFYHWVARSGYVLPMVTFFMAFLTTQSISFLENWEPKGALVWGTICLLVYGFALAAGVPIHLLSFWLSALMIFLAGVKTNLLMNARPALWVGAFLFSIAPVLQSLNFTLSRDYFDVKPSVLAGVKDRERVYYTPDAIQHFEIVSGKGVGDIYEQLKQGISPNWPLGCGLGECYQNNPFFLLNGFRWNFSILRAAAPEASKILNYLGAGIIVGHADERGLKRFAELENGILFYQNPNVFPHWISVNQAFEEKDWNNDFNLMASPNFRFERFCFIANQGQVGVYSKRTISEISRRPNQVQLDASGNGKALLVSNESYYPGWKVFVDGQERTLEEVNHGFRGIVLQNGETHVALDYRPDSFRLGLYFSLLSCMGWIGLLGFGIGAKKEPV